VTDFSTIELLDEIQRRCDKATAGPWLSFVEGLDHSSGSSFIRTAEDDIYLIGGSTDDQDFIANARQDLPRLAKEMRALRELLIAKK